MRLKWETCVWHAKHILFLHYILFTYANTVLLPFKHELKILA